MNICLMRLASIAAAILTLVITGCGGSQPDRQAPPLELNISAAASLKTALTEIQMLYADKRPEVKLILNLGASGSLQRQIVQGAPADVFLSAAIKPMNDLDVRGLILPASRINLLENQLVLVVPRESGLNMTSFSDITAVGVGAFAMGEPSTVPVGQYTREALTSLRVWEAAGKKAVMAKDARSLLTYVESGNVDAGFVYRTDAAGSAKVRIVAIAPPGSHQPIVYPVAVVATTRNPAASQAFLDFLSSPAARDIFQKHGFVMAK